MSHEQARETAVHEYSARELRRDWMHPPDGRVRRERAGSLAAPSLDLFVDPGGARRLRAELIKALRQSSPRFAANGGASSETAAGAPTSRLTGIGL